MSTLRVLKFVSRRNFFSGFFAWTKDCKAANSLSIVKEDCQGKRSCVLEADNGKFSDPCFLTQKYLEVHYRCRR
ncbi:L-rhamnose-binding lectin ELEL-1-like [Oculina patagonica]